MLCWCRSSWHPAEKEHPNIRRMVFGAYKNFVSVYLCLHLLTLTEQEHHTGEYSIYTECLLSKLSLSGLFPPWPTNGNRIIDGRFVSYKNIQFILQRSIKCCSSDPMQSCQGRKCQQPAYEENSPPPTLPMAGLCGSHLHSEGEKWKGLMGSQLSKCCQGF